VLLSRRRTRLFGYEQPAGEVRALLGAHRFVTLTGSGGCGKTRLALEVAQERPDAVWVDLAPLSDPALVAQTVAVAVGVDELGAADLTAALVAGLAKRDVLLVLDNCEHLVASVAALVDLLPCRVLATSREPLGVVGEAVYRVRSLAVADAMDLFRDRAAHARGGADPTDDAAVREICERLDGIPLAVELAAARTRMMTERQVAALLHDRFRLLTGGARTAVARQRTLEASMSWSYDLLDEEEATLLRSLSVFRGSFDLASAADVSGHGASVLEGLSRLVDRSLAEPVLDAEQARYRLLETVREFAHRQLVASDEAAATRDRHLQYFLSAAEAREPQLVGPDLLVHLAAADAEQDETRAAMDWALASDQSELALRLAGANWLYWFLRRRFDEGRAHLEAPLRDAQDAPPLVRFKALLALLMLCLGTDWVSAAAFAEQAVQAAELTGLDTLRSQALAWRGQARVMVGHPEGLADLEESLRLARVAGDPAHLSRSLQWLGASVALADDLPRGTALLDEAVALDRATGNELQLGWALAWRARAALLAGDSLSSTAFAEESDAVLARRGEVGFRVMPLGEISLAWTFRGRPDEARAAARRAADVAALAPSPMALAFASLARAQAHWSAAALEDAAEAFREGHQLLESCGMHTYAALDAVLRGRVLLQLGRGDEAEQLVEDGLSRAVAFDMARIEALVGLAYVRLDTGRLLEAVAAAREAWEVAVAGSQRNGMVSALLCLGLATWEQGEQHDAARMLATALATLDRWGHVPIPDTAARLARLPEVARQLPAWQVGWSSSLEDTVEWLGRGRGPRGRPSTGWDSLTPTELEVARLVARGLSNPEIAETLFVSRNTVKAHLAHTYTKLGITTRAALATEVTRRLTQVDG